jgi:uncharacterized repeat protein (TIGR04076 family)
MSKEGSIDLHIDFGSVRNFDEYHDLWRRLGRIEVRMVEQHEECRHKVGDVFIYENPYQKPAEMCPALLHVLDLYVWRVAFGFPSWNTENRRVYRLHCPDPRGTVWEMERIDE